MPVIAFGFAAQIVFWPRLRRCCELCCRPYRLFTPENADESASAERFDRLQAEDRLRAVLVFPPRRFSHFVTCEETLGRGGFGTVFRGVATPWGLNRVDFLEHGRVYAVRQIRFPRAGLPEDIYRSVLQVSPERHVEFLQALMDVRCGSNNIVKVFGMFLEIRAQRTAFQLMEVLEGPDLFDFIKSVYDRTKAGMQEHLASEITVQIVNAVHYLHRVIGALHRDIKPENFGFLHQVAEGEPLPPLKLFDFGLGTVLPGPVTEETASTLLCLPVAGTVDYMAPETWGGHSGPSSDIWAIGLIVFFMIAMELPFQLLDKKQPARDAVEQKSLKFDDRRWAHVSSSAKTFISKLLEKDHSRRTHSSAILLDPWLQRAADMSELPSTTPMPLPTLTLPERSQTFRSGGLDFFSFCV